MGALENDGPFQPPRRREEVKEVKELPDGSRLQTMADGTTIQRRPDGTKITTWHGQDGLPKTTKETLPDGTKITQRADGSTSVLQPDGTKVVHWPDGTCRETRPDGTKIETAPNGSEREIHPEGSSTMRLPDGGIVEMLPDGSRLAAYANGSRVHAKPDGSKVTLHSDGTLVESFTDGSKSTTWADGNRKETRPDGTKAKKKLSPEEVEKSFQKISVWALRASFKKVLALDEGEQLQALSASWRHLPLQLQRLPRHRIFAIQQCMMVLEEAGLSSVPAGFLNSMEGEVEDPQELSEYQLLCSWAHTPALWEFNTGMPDPKANCRLWGLQPEERERLRAEAAKEEEEMQALVPPPTNATASDARVAAATRRAKDKLQAGQACFNAWWEAMLQAGRELECFAVEGWAPRRLGEGLSPLFAEAPSPWPALPEPQARRRRREAEAAAAAGGPKEPARRREGFERGFGKTVWFMSAGEDFFGERPAVKWPKKEGTRAKASNAGPAPRPPGTVAAVTLHLGGAGCGLGLAAWDRLCAEHGIGAKGRPVESTTEDLLVGSPLHFAEAASGRYVPRTVFADCGAGSLDTARAAGLFAPVDLVELPEDARSGFRNCDGRACARVLEALRMELEQADAVRCLAVTQSLQGSTGAALSAGLGVALAQEYPKLIHWSLALAPGCSPDLLAADSYNTIHSLWALRHSYSLVTLADNDALHRLASSKPFGLGLESPGFAEYNGLLGRVLADFTSPMRAGGLANASEGWSDLLPSKAVSSLVPYPRVNFTFAAIAPLVPKEMADFDVVSDRATVLNCLTRGALLSGKPLAGRCLTAALWCRGLARGEALAALAQYGTRRDVHLADFVPSAFALGSLPGIRGAPASAMALRSATGLLAGTTAPWRDAFDTHFQLREGLAPFLESGGIEEAELQEAREDASAAAADAADLEVGTEDG